MGVGNEVAVGGTGVSTVVGAFSESVVAGVGEAATVGVTVGVEADIGSEVGTEAGIGRGAGTTVGGSVGLGSGVNVGSAAFVGTGGGVGIGTGSGRDGRPKQAVLRTAATSITAISVSTFHAPISYGMIPLPERRTPTTGTFHCP